MSSTNRLRDWKVVAERVREELREDRASLAAAGVAFYAFLSAIPALAALVSVYGLFADPDDVGRHVRGAFGVLPADARQLLVSQLSRIVEKPAGTLGVSFVIAVAVALWSASKGAAYLLDAIGLAYGARAGRGAVRGRAVALACTVGAMVVTVAAVTAASAVPDHVPEEIRWPVRVALWAALALLGFLGLALVYRLGAARDEARWRWADPGSALALVLLVLATVGLNLYVTHLGSYNATYGALAGVVVLMLWLQLAAFIVIVGAAVNAVLERDRAGAATAASRSGPV